MRLLFTVLACSISLSICSQTSLSTAINFTVTDLNGNSHTLSDYLNDDKYVCIDFMAYWCGPCMSVADDYTSVYNQYGCNNGDVIFLGIEYEGTHQQVLDFEFDYGGENPPPYVSGDNGGGGDVHSIYGIQAFPTFILINPDGEIVEPNIWPMDAGILDGVLASYGLEHNSCEDIIGCTNPWACNFDPDANITDNSLCEYPEFGYDCDGICNVDTDGDGICDVFEIPGCTDQEAINYEEYATDDDGSCFYFSPSCDSIGEEYWSLYETGIYPASNTVVFGVYTSKHLAINANETIIEAESGQEFSLIDLTITDVVGLPGSMSIDYDSNTLYPVDQDCINISGTPFEIGEHLLQFNCEANATVFGFPIQIELVLEHLLVIEENPNPIAGCTYTNASNFNIYATVDDGSCIFFGCMDQEAPNYNPLSNFDDGTCEEPGSSSGCVSDINEDGTVTTQDLLLLLAVYGTTCE